MAVTLPSVYQDGTATVAANGTVVTGQSTLWANAVLPGDWFGVHKGYAIRILSVDSNTQLTLANPWPSAAQTAAHYEIMLCPDTSRMQETSRQLLQQLGNGNIAAFTELTGAPDTLGYFTGAGTMALTGLTATGRDIIDSADVSAAQTALGVSTFIKGLLNDADASTALSTLGVSDYAKTLLDDANASAALSTLGVSEFIKTLLDDANQAAARTTLGAQAALGFTPINKAGDTVTGPLDFTGSANSWHQRASNPITLAANGGNLAIQNGAGLLLIGEDLSAGGSALFLLSQTSTAKIADPGGYYSTTLGNTGTINVGYLSGTGMIINNGRTSAVTVKTILFQSRSVV